MRSRNLPLALMGYGQHIRGGFTRFRLFPAGDSPIGGYDPFGKGDGCARRVVEFMDMVNLLHCRGRLGKPVHYPGKIGVDTHEQVDTDAEI